MYHQILLKCSFFLVYSRAIVASPDTAQIQSNSCLNSLQAAGVTEYFGSNVGHSIHSINVRALQKFEPTTTEKNSVPTVNLDLSSSEAVLSYAPDRRGPSEATFHSEGMKSLDEVLSRMDDQSFGLRGFTILEKVVHAFHMEEAWAMIRQEYEKIKANPPSKDVCKCAMDIEKNGILEKLRFTALAIREPQLIYGNNMNLDKKDAEKGGYNFAYKFNDKEKLPKQMDLYSFGYEFGLKKPQQNAISENKRDLSTDEILKQDLESMPRLVDVNAWEKWKEILTMRMEDHFDTAFFLYCALKN